MRRQHKEIDRQSARQNEFLNGKGFLDNEDKDDPLSPPPSPPPEPDGKAPFLIVSATHAREYTPPILVRLWLERLLEKVEAGDPDFLSMLEHTRIHWIPYLNPDGRVVAETDEPFRRKNMNNEWTGDVADSLVCPADAFGVDLNRNMPYEWGNDDGSSVKPCSYDSRGSGPGSEPETRTLVKYATGIYPAPQRAFSALNAAGTDYNVVHTPGLSMDGESSRHWRGYDPRTTRGVFADIHSYGRVYIYPWGNTNAISPNDRSFRSAMGHIQSMTGNTAMGPGPNHYGVASGATDDWAYGVLGAFSMTWELGREFHEPCEDFAKDAPKHFGSFEYLMKIAPFPFALGMGPVLRDAEGGLPKTLELFYRPAYGDVDGEIDGDDEAALLRPLGDSNATVQKDAPLSSMFRPVRMGTNTAYDIGPSLRIAVAAKLPEVIPSDEDPIDFGDFDDDIDDDDDGFVEYHEHDGKQRRRRRLYRGDAPSSIATIRVFFSGGNPLVGIDSVDDIGRGGDYLEVDVTSGGEESFPELEDGFRLYEIFVPMAEVWEAFGIESYCPQDDDDEPVVTTTTEHTLYFQAIDDVGNPGPITAQRMTVMVLPEVDGDDDDDDDGFVFGAVGGNTATAPSAVPAVRPTIDWYDQGKNANLVRTVEAEKAVVDCSPSSGAASASALASWWSWWNGGGLFFLGSLVTAVW